MVVGDNRWPLMSDARLYVQTSRYEGLPIALLEAMSLGRPVLVTPETNIADEVRAAGAGIVAGADVDQIAAGLLLACSAASERLDAFGANARRMVRERYSWRTVAARMTTAYEAAVISSRGGRGSNFLIEEKKES
jgi:glycosyltransferase involved in cell wall biosynthesis